jgi:hypothetical protein
MMGGLLGNFTIIFGKHNFSKVKLHLKSNIKTHHVSVWKGFSIYPLTYNFQHFEPIEYVNGVSKILHAFKINNPKMIFNLDEFLSCSKSMIQLFTFDT